MDLNTHYILGRVGNDPELKETTTGQKVLTLSVATKDVYTSGGERKESTEWHEVVLWGDRATFIANVIHKGDKVFVEGKVRTKEWENKNGEKRTRKQIVARLVIPSNGKKVKDQVEASWEDAQAILTPKQELSLDGIAF